MSLLSDIARRLRLMVTRGIVELVNDGLKCQGLQVSLLSDEVQDDVERFQDYGFTSVPLQGAEALFLSVGGDRANGVVVSVTDRRWRPRNLNAGDVCLFIALANGERVYLDATADIVNLGAKSAAAFVARVGDKTVADTSMTAWITAVSTFTGAPAPTDFGVISTGATKVKAT